MSDSELIDHVEEDAMDLEPESQSPAEKLPPYEAGPEAVDITLNKDGGVLKEIKRHGVGDDHPMTGDKVFVHYVGTLTDGTKFDSSRDRGDQFQFDLGKGSVIKAWDIGVATMKRGELAVLLCKPEYAYGKTGSPPKIPPNATLVFEVELFDWKGEDVSENKDGGVIRSQLEKGDGYLTPREGASCDIHIIGRYNDRVFEDRDVNFVVGEGSEAGVIEGIDQAIKKFKKSERSRLKVMAKYAYGAEGCSAYDIPPNTDLEYDVHLKQFEKEKESWEMDMTEKLEQSEIKKNKGTDFFKAGKFKLAMRYYKKVVDYLKEEGAEHEQRQALLLAAHLNLAMCHLKLNEDLDALNSCDEALKLDPKNEKGLFRRATAHFNLQNFEESVRDFQAVLELDPNNKAAKNQLIIVSHKVKQIREKEKQTYAGMFQKFAELDAKKEKTEHPPAEPKSEETTETSSVPEVKENPSAINGDAQTVEMTANA